jgi:hypothetical protein
MLVGLIMLSSGCAGKRLSPIVGKDIIRVNKGDTCPISGTLFSDYYLKQYLKF